MSGYLTHSFIYNHPLKSFNILKSSTSEKYSPNLVKFKIERMQQELELGG